MPLSLPRMTTFDPPGSSEGTLDPLGLYQIADQLATMLVPGVRERMDRVRFLTPMAVGAIVTEGLEADPEQPACPPFLIWEWLVIEAFIREIPETHRLRSVPGARVTRRALDDLKYLDARHYLKTPRVFGFHGIYKRLANHVGLLDVHLDAAAECERLVDAWSRDQGLDGLAGIRPTLQRWRTAVERSLASNPCRTRPAWTRDDWRQLAESFVPGEPGREEKQAIHRLLHADGERSMGALPAIWKLQPEFDDADYSEEALHQRLHTEENSLRPLLQAIEAYERFCRGLTDGFDRIRVHAAEADIQGFEIARAATDSDFVASIKGLEQRFKKAYGELGEVSSLVAGLFSERFDRFAQSLAADEAAYALCEHHEAIQRAKSADGKRAWFHRLSAQQIYMRQRYRVSPSAIAPTRYVHSYRGVPIRHFHADLRW